VRSLLLKYASLFGIVAVATLLISAITPLFGTGSLIRGSVNIINTAPAYAYRQEDGGAVAKAVAENVATNITQAPDVLVVGTKGLADTWAANVTPVLASTHAPVSTMAIPIPTVVPTTLLPLPAPTPPVGFMASGTGPVVPWLDPALAFFLGGVLVIFILVCYEAWIWKKYNT
jgi:hypothetical protein